ncbi:protein preY, mitochondrial [Sphaeramia orbicularis]|uniref:Protein preY, mitochondrial n=1 Tax=Sphaeramia orbicularis TaxID=375764 RepID=A0A672Y353_9TELE|nr:protein preY, mitochondrial [Sphaeramia orbicularis]
MFYNVLRRLAIEAGSVQRYVNSTAHIRRVGAVCVSVRRFTDVKDGAQPPFDASLLQVLVCPLSKKPLRYEAETNELINEELGIAYPIIDGIPNMIPQEARLIQKDADASNTSQQK